MNISLPTIRIKIISPPIDPRKSLKPKCNERSQKRDNWTKYFHESPRSIFWSEYVRQRLLASPRTYLFDRLRIKNGFLAFLDLERPDAGLTVRPRWKHAQCGGQKSVTVKKQLRKNRRANVKHRLRGILCKMESFSWLLNKRTRPFIAKAREPWHSVA